MIGTPESFTPSPALQQMTRTALELREAYQSAQRTFTECEQETRRLEQVAAALDAEAAQAEQAGKELAMAPEADQRKINAAFEHAAKQRMDAEKYRRTAQMRGELRFLLIKQMDSARAAAAPACSAVTTQGIRERVANLLETEGLAALVGELRALLKLAEAEGMADVRDGIIGLELGRLLESVAALLAHNLNVSAAAEALYVHRNTLRFRLEKIKKILHLDPCRRFQDAVLCQCLLAELKNTQQIL